MAVKWLDGIHREHNAVFGLCPASGIEVCIADTCIDILKHWGIAPVLKWVNGPVQGLHITPWDIATHFLHVHHDSHAYLPPLSAFMSKFSNNHILHHIPGSILENLHW
jgi:hypothetical protein